MAEFDFKELVARAHFDYVGPAFPLWWKNNKTKFVFPNLMGIGRELLLGGRYFTTLKVASNKKFAYKFGSTVIESDEREEFVFPNEPLLSISLAKTIIETATVGKERKGTVKEYICTEDYNINIKGVCINENDPEIYPAEQVASLKRMFEINDSLEVISNPFLELFEIRNIVLKDIQFDEMAGEQGLQKFTITAVSDQDFYADLTEREKTLKTLQ